MASIGDHFEVRERKRGRERGGGVEREREGERGKEGREKKFIVNILFFFSF